MRVANRLQPLIEQRACLLVATFRETSNEFLDLRRRPLETQGFAYRRTVPYRAVGIRVQWRPHPMARRQDLLPRHATTTPDGRGSRTCFRPVGRPASGGTSTLYCPSPAGPSAPNVVALCSKDRSVPSHLPIGNGNDPLQSIHCGVANQRVCGKAGRHAPRPPAPRPNARS